MLYNPDWDNTTLKEHILNIDTIMDWAKTKDPAEKFEFTDTCGECFFSQYLNTFPGYQDHLVPVNFRLPASFRVWQSLHDRYASAIRESSTFREAVINLEKYKEEGYAA